MFNDNSMAVQLAVEVYYRACNAHVPLPCRGELSRQQKATRWVPPPSSRPASKQMPVAGLVACTVRSRVSPARRCMPVLSMVGVHAAQVPLFQTAVVDGQREVTGIEPVFSSRLNPGNSFLVVVEVRVQTPCPASHHEPACDGLPWWVGNILFTQSRSPGLGVYTCPHSAVP
jgi:hypothetical protein